MDILSLSFSSSPQKGKISLPILVVYICVKEFKSVLYLNLVGESNKFLLNPCVIKS